MDDDYNDDNWWQAQDEQAVREEAEFVRTLLLVTLIAIYKELETTERILQ